MNDTCPLVVDLDGTLIHTDMLHESVLKILRDRPLHTLRIPYWLFRGKATLKQQLAQRVDFDPSLLPYNTDLLDWLKQQRAAGRKLILCTATDLSVATLITEHLGFFDELIASDGHSNLAGKQKAATLEQRFGSTGFDYVGNSRADLAVWQCARRAIVVNASNRLTKRVEAQCEVERIFPSRILGMGIWHRMMRSHQWLKNLLLFIPMLAAHHITNLTMWLTLAMAFVSFSLCASAVYICNDLLDLESDRQHLRKRKRPFASGLVPTWVGVIVAPLLLLGSLTIAERVGNLFSLSLLFYFLLTCAYSWKLKRLVLVDCLTLAILYTMRIIAGAMAVGLSLSFWLLAFSLFLFLSLAFVKRYAELQSHLHSDSDKAKAHGRGYYTDDLFIIQTLGVASGYAAVLVLALYLNSYAVLQLYRTPEWVWGTVPVMLFWVSWVWLQAHRGKMHDDPLIFAVKDKASFISGLIFAGFLVLGTMSWIW